MNQKESAKTLSYIVSSEQQKADCLMAVYDAWGTQAHVAGLGKIGIMKPDEVKQVLQVLEQIKKEAKQGNFAYDPGLGAQLTLEKLVTENTSREIGGKIHTGRSRNDQVTTTQKLYVRDQVLDVLSDIQILIGALLQLAAVHIETVMPGYTHMQPAKPTTFGQWCLGFADMLSRDIERIQQSYLRHNTCPLGAAESYGTSWPLDRMYVAQLLAFDGVQEVPLDAVGCRGEFEIELLTDFSLLMLHCSKLAQDLLMMNTFESGQIALGEQVAERMGKLTGSSIMPQKKNPDVLELVRANAGMVYGLLFSGLEVLKALPMGYNRDSRESKELIMSGFMRTNETVVQLASVLNSLQVNKERMLQLVRDNYSLATDLADYLAQTYNLPYRSLYKVVGALVKELIAQDKKLYEATPELIVRLAKSEGLDLSLGKAELSEALDPVLAIQKRKHIGGACQQQMQNMLRTRESKLQQTKEWVLEQKAQIQKAKEKISLLIKEL